MIPRRKPLLAAAGILSLLLLCVGYVCLTGTIGAVGLAATVAIIGVTMSISSVVSGGGSSIQTLPYLRTGSAGIPHEETIAIATTGTLSTRSTDVAGTLTVATGHTIVTGDKIDVFWDGGVAYSATVGTVAAAPSDTSIPFTLAVGDVLPAQDTVIKVSEQLVVNTMIDGDEVAAISFVFTTTDTALRTACHIQFVDSDAAEVAELDFTTNVPRTFDFEGGDTNVLTGNIITKMKIGQAGLVAATLKTIGVQDASP